MKSVVMKASIISFGIASVLRVVSSWSTSGSFFYLLFPGVVADLYTTGGHGGTTREQLIGFVACIFVNTLVYSLILTVLLMVWRQIKKHATSKAD